MQYRIDCVMIWKLSMLLSRITPRFEIGGDFLPISVTPKRYS